MSESVLSPPRQEANDATLFRHAGGMADYDLLDGNLTDCLLQAEVVRACLCQQSPPWRCQEEAMDPVGSVAGCWRRRRRRWRWRDHSRVGCLMRRRETHRRRCRYHKPNNSCLTMIYSCRNIAHIERIAFYYVASSLSSRSLALSLRGCSSFVSCECASVLYALA